MGKGKTGQNVFILLESWLRTFICGGKYQIWCVFTQTMTSGLYRGTNEYIQTHTWLHGYWISDADTARSVCGVRAETRQIHKDYRVLWRKRDGMATLSRGELHADPCLERLLLLFWAHFRGWSSFTTHRFALGGYLLQKTKERMLLITSKRKDICKCKGKSG